MASPALLRSESCAIWLSELVRHCTAGNVRQHIYPGADYYRIDCEPMLINACVASGRNRSACVLGQTGRSRKICLLRLNLLGDLRTATFSSVCAGRRHSLHVFGAHFSAGARLDRRRARHPGGNFQSCSSLSERLCARHLRAVRNGAAGTNG